jgi:hypothetical protein
MSELGPNNGHSAVIPLPTANLAASRIFLKNSELTRAKGPCAGSYACSPSVEMAASHPISVKKLDTSLTIRKSTCIWLTSFYIRMASARSSSTMV